MYVEDGSPSPAVPVPGQDFMPLRVGDVVDVILQNLPANANGARASPLNPHICLPAQRTAVYRLRCSLPPPRGPLKPELE